MNLPNRSVLCAGLLASSALWLLPSNLKAQTKSEETDNQTTKDETVVLSPFKVTAERDRGYKATNATSGTRLNEAIKDLPMPISVITEQFIRDTGALDLRKSLSYMAGIQLQSQNDQGTPGGAYQGPGGVNNPEGATANKTQTSYKIRGYITDAVLRDGFRRQNSTDSINISRIEVAFGPTALLYGIGEFGGIVNYIPKAPQAKPMTQIGLSYGSYDFMRATLDTTGQISKTWDFNFRLTGALQSTHDYTDFKKETHDFISPAISFRPTKKTQVDIDYESGRQDQKGVGFPRVRAMQGVGINSDQNEHSDFYTLPGTNPYTFRWSGPDTYVNSTASNFRAQVAQQITPNINLLVGYNSSKAKWDSRDVNGNLTSNQGPIALQKTVIFNPFLDPAAQDSNLNVVAGPVNNVILQYFWQDTQSEISHNQFRGELNWKFELFEKANKWMRIDSSILVGHSEEYQHNSYSTIKTIDNLYNYKAPTDASPIRFGKQGDGTSDVAMVPKEDGYSNAWNQATYLVYAGKFLDNRLMIVSGMRDDRSDNFVHWHSTVWNAASDVRSAKVKSTTYQNGVSFQITPHISAFALKAEGIQPNFSGGRDVNGNPMPPVLAKSKEFGLKFDLLEGKISGSVSSFKIKREGTALNYWWAPTSNDIKFKLGKDVVFQINDYIPVSLGGPTWTNQAGSHDMAKWNAAVAAGSIYQATNSNGQTNWYVNGSKSTGAAWLNSVFDYTKSVGMSWPGWLYNSDNLTNNSFDDIAAAKGESVIGTDEGKGWSIELMFTPNNNFQVVANYSHVEKIITSAGHFAKYPANNPWAVWFFPNTDWGLTGKPLSTVYTDPSDTSTWTGIGYGSGEKQDDTPEHVVTAWANYQFTDGRYKGLAFGLGASWESPREYQSGITHGGGQRITDKNGNIIVLKTPTRTNVNMMARYAFKLYQRDASVQLNIDNLMDDRKRYGLIYAAPRSVRLEFNTKF